jgi:hypothetical protein
MGHEFITMPRFIRTAVACTASAYPAKTLLNTAVDCHTMPELCAALCCLELNTAKTQNQ